MPCAGQPTITWGGIENKIAGNLSRGRYISKPELANLLGGYTTVPEFRHFVSDLDCKADAKTVDELAERLTTELGAAIDTFAGPSPAPQNVNDGSQAIMAGNEIRNLQVVGESLALGLSTDGNTLVVQSSAASDEDLAKLLLTKADLAVFEAFSTTASGKLLLHDTQLNALSGVLAEAAKLSTLSVSIDQLAAKAAKASGWAPTMIIHAESSEVAMYYRNSVGTVGNPWAQKRYGFLPAEAGIIGLPPSFNSTNTFRCSRTIPKGPVGSAGGWLDDFTNLVWLYDHPQSYFKSIQHEVAGEREIDPFIVVNSLFTLPLAQAWGGRIKGQIEVSFYVMAPPSQSLDVSLVFYHGRGGWKEDGTPVEAALPGAVGTSAAGAPTGTACSLTISTNGLISGALKTMMCDLDVFRRAKENELDPQYFFMLTTSTKDPTLVLSDLKIRINASAAWAWDKVPEWSGWDTPASVKSINA